MNIYRIIDMKQVENNMNNYTNSLLTIFIVNNIN